MRCDYTALLNLISNGFYASAKRRLSEGPEYAPTRNLGHSVEIRTRDNGSGIPDDVGAKMFNPVFTPSPLARVRDANGRSVQAPLS